MKILGLEIKRVGKYKPLVIPGGLQWIGGHSRITDAKAKTYIDDGYLGNADIYSIVKLSCSKFSSIPCYVYDVRDHKSLRRYKTLAKGMLTKSALDEMSELKRKALGEVDESSDLARFISQPNEYMGQDAFLEMAYMYRIVTGGSAIYINDGNLGGEGQPVEMEVLPSQFIQIIGDGTLFGVDSYRMVNTNINFTAKDILYWKYPNPDFNMSGTHLYGLSPLRAAINVMQGSNDAIRATVAMFQNQGAKGILFNNSENSPISKEEREILQAYTDENINDSNNKGRIMAINAKVGYTQIGLSATDMDLLNAIGMTRDRLCNVFQVPPGLLEANSTFDNRAQDMKYFITNKIVPEWANFRDELNRKIKSRFKNAENLYIDFDVQDLPELQEDMGKIVTNMMNADWLTMNEKREAMRYDPIEKPEFNTAYTTNTKVPLEEAFESTGNSLPDDEVNEDATKDIYK